MGEEFSFNTSEEWVSVDPAGPSVIFDSTHDSATPGNHTIIAYLEYQSKTYENYINVSVIE